MSPTESGDVPALSDPQPSSPINESTDNSPTTEEPGTSEKPEMTEEEKQKMMQEMMGGLKNLGNMFLKPFGLSTDSFEMVPQPGGGYSVQMKK